jgi:hypothetical protein
VRAKRATNPLSDPKSDEIGFAFSSLIGQVYYIKTNDLDPSWIGPRF